MYNIEKNKPIPKFRLGREPKYPFAEMEPGDSFVAPKNARAAAYVYGMRSNATFMTRAVDKDHIRIWRVA